MAILCLLGLWTLYFWLVQKCVRRSFAGMKAWDRNAIEARRRRLRVHIPETVPTEWIEEYKAENDA
jgi:hypothetical protein